MGPRAIRAARRRACDWTRPGCGDAARRVDRVAAARAAAGDCGRRATRRSRQQERLGKYGRIFHFRLLTSNFTLQVARFFQQPVTTNARSLPVGTSVPRTTPAAWRARPDDAPTRSG